MRNSQIKKRRNLQRSLRSGHRPHGYKLFARYFPQSSYHDPHTGQINWRLWDQLNHNCCWHAEYKWAHKLTAYLYTHHSGPPSWYRKKYNRQLKARQKAAFRKMILDGEMDDFMILPHIRTIRRSWY